MKKLLVILSMLTCSVALAMPKVGDYVSHDYTFTKNGVVTPAVVEREFTAYDSVTKQFTVKETTHYKGKVYVDEYKVDGDRLPTEERVQVALDQCSGPDLNGHLEDVTTPAGVFKTCAVANADSVWKGTIYMGKVPTGIVKIDVTSAADGTHQVTVVKEFRLGQ
jgi:hypothetical protein